MTEHLHEAVEFLRHAGVHQPTIGIVLGTGLGNIFVEQIKDKLVIDYAIIPHFPVSTVETHSGKLVYGEVHGKMVLAMQGRFHYYEGYSMQQITFPVRVMKLLGIRYLLLSNAAGNMNMKWAKGQLMLLDDHINLQPDNPLRGVNASDLGPRFPDMSQPYDRYLNTELQAIAKAQGLTLNQGVYVSVTGPNLETRAEYRYLRALGADAVGMSTVPEVIVANHMSLPCCAVSVLTDDCDPDNLAPANIADIIKVAHAAESGLVALFIELIKRIVLK